MKSTRTEAVSAAPAPASPASAAEAAPASPDRKPRTRPEASQLPPRINLAGGMLLLGLLILLGAMVSLVAVIVVLGLIFMIFLHEMGHFATARFTGMKASEFFIGFGPRIWSFKRGETEYGVRILPLGAYVRILGMSNLEEIAPEEEARTYRSKPYASRLLVAVAGSAMHFLLALAVLWSLFSAVGYYPANTTSEQVYARWEVAEVVADSPALAAGFQPGDKIVGVQSAEPAAALQELPSYYDVSDFILEHPNQQVVFLVERQGEVVSLPTDLGTWEAAGSSQSGSSESGSSQSGWLGIASQRLDPPTTGIIAGLGDAVVEFGQLTKLLASDFVRIFSPGGLGDLFGNVFTDDPAPAVAVDGIDADDNRVVSIYGVTRLATNLGDSGNWSLLLFLYAAVNIFIGMFNLLPLPPFDGGHVVVATYERLRSRPHKPYRIDATKLIPIQYAVLAIFVAIGVAALYLDVVDPIGV